MMYFSYGPSPEVPRPQVLAPHPLAPVVPIHLDLRAEPMMMPAPLDPGPPPMSPKMQPPEVSPEVPTLSPRQPPAPNLEPPEPADPSPQVGHLGAWQGVDESYQPEESKENEHLVPKTKIARILAERKMRTEANSQVSQTSDKQIVQVSVETSNFAKSCKVEVHIHGLENLHFCGVPQQAI